MPSPDKNADSRSDFPKEPKSPGLIVRPVEPEDAPAVYRILSAGLDDVLPDGQRWLKRWRWQYWLNPYRLNRPAGWVLEDDGDIVGHLGAVYLPLRIGQQRMTGVVAADYVVAEQALKTGGMFAGLQLAQSLFDELQTFLILATTANDKTGAVFGRFGCRPVDWSREFWRIAAEPDQLYRLCRGGDSRAVRRLWNSPLRTLLAGWSRFSAKRLHSWAHVPIPVGCRLDENFPDSPSPIGRIYEQLVTGHFGAGMQLRPDVFLRWPAALGVDRSQDYLDWRYVHHPERENLRVLTVRDREKRPIGGAVIFMEDKGDSRRAYVEEMVVYPGRRDVMHTLYAAALRLAIRHEMQYLVTTSGRREIRPIFWELGFESRARSAPAVIVREQAEGLPANVLPQPLADHFEFWHGEAF